MVKGNSIHALESPFLKKEFVKKKSSGVTLARLSLTCNLMKECTKWNVARKLESRDLYLQAYCKSKYDFIETMKCFHFADSL